MQTLIFNTTTKTVKLYEGKMTNSEILSVFENVPTVRVSESHYEVMQKDEFEKSFPVLRVPICNTNMFINK